MQVFFFDEFLVFVKLFKVIYPHVFEANFLCTIDVVCVGHHAELHTETRYIRYLRRPRKTFVSSGIVVLWNDLEINSFDEFSLFLTVGVAKKFLYEASYT